MRDGEEDVLVSPVVGVVCTDGGMEGAVPDPVAPLERTGWTGRALLCPVGSSPVENAAREVEVNMRGIITLIR
jgi:hypothetical protein